METLSNDAHPYSSEENDMITRGQKSIADFLANTQKKKVSFESSGRSILEGGNLPLWSFILMPEPAVPWSTT